jgi:hypothetical protein
MEKTLTPVRTTDVTGLPEDAVRAMESLVTLLRGQVPSPVFPSRAEWIEAIREWASGHKSVTTSADWSRQSIYAGRGE